MFLESTVGHAGREELRSASLIEWALNTPSCNLRDEINFFVHFRLMMKHPIINIEVRNAAWHGYRLPD
jgi:hypothetical protein